MMRKVLLFLLLCIFCPSISWAASSLKYLIDAEYDSNSKLLVASEIITYTNDSKDSLDELHLNVYANKKYSKKERKRIGFYQNYFKANVFPSGVQDPKFKVDSVESNGKSLRYVINGEFETNMYVYLEKPLEPGQSIELQIKFQFELLHQMGLIGHHSGIASLGYWYPAMAVYKNGQWNDNPLGTNHQPYFFPIADFDVRLTVESDQIVAYAGELIKEQKKAGKKTLTMQAKNMREFALAMSKDYKIIEKQIDGKKIKLYHLPYDQMCADKGIDYAVDAMRYYTKNFGPYPYKEFKIAETHIGWLGNEFSSMIFIDSRGFNIPDILFRHLDFLISHEMAHQWWYAQVGSNQYKETFLDEAFASYFGTLYLEEKYGKENNYLELPKMFEWLPDASFWDSRTQRYLAKAKGNADEAILKPIDEFESVSNNFVSPYEKGSWVLHMLRNLLGDELFFKTVRDYVKTYKFKTVNIDEFIEFWQDKTGRDLEYFFDIWLNTTEKCDYAIAGIKRKKDNGNFVTSVDIERRANIIMPITVRATSKSGQVFEQEIDGKAEKFKLEFLSDNKISKVEIDPERKVLDYRIENNAKPFKKRIEATPFYGTMYDFTALNPSDRFSIIYGTVLSVFNVGVRASGRWLNEHMTSIDSRYDFHHKEIKTVFEHDHEHLFGDDLTLSFIAGHNYSVDSSERFTRGRLQLKKKLGPSIMAIDKVENDMRLYYEVNREHDLQHNIYNRRKIGFERNWDYRILSWNPVYGARYKFNFEYGGQYMGSNTDFFKTEFDGRFYKNFGDMDYIWANRLDLGLSHGDVDGEERFSLGGRESLRGFGDGEFRNQNKLMINSEFRFPLIDEREKSLLRNFMTFNRFNGVLFYDTGLSWDRQIHTGDIKQNIGFGFRWEITLLGFFEKTMNRLDIAVPVNEGEKDVHIWFDITHAF